MTGTGASPGPPSGLGSGPSAGRRIRPRWAVPVSIAVISAWWLLVWATLEPSVLTRVPILDELFYLREGAAIADGQWFTDQPFFMSPVYPYLVAVSGSGQAPGPDGVLSEPPVGLRLVQALAWAAVAWLLFGAARRLLRSRGLSPRAATRWAYLPPLLFLLYRPAAVFVSTALLEIPLALAVTAYLYVISSWVGDGPTDRAGSGTVRYLGAGLLVGLAALLRPHAILLLLAGWLVLRRRARRDRMLLVIGALALLLPVMAFNSARVGRPAGISLNAGLNLYIGQGPAATGLFTTFTGFDAEEDPAGVDYLSGRLGRRVDGPGEADRIWLREAWRSITAAPVRAVGLWLRKVWLHIQGWEIAQITPLDSWSRAAPPLRLLIVPFGLISALALWGLVFPGWREPGLRPWIVGLGLLVGGQSFFFVVTRYRLTVVPILCLLAGLGCVEGLAAVAPRWRRRLGFVTEAPRSAAGRRRLQAVVALVVALLAVQPWGLAEVRRFWTAVSAENEAVRWSRWALRDDAEPQQRTAALEQAERYYHRSLATEPGRWLAYRGLARTLIAAGQPDAAIASLEDGIVRARNPELLNRELILLLLQQERLEEALVEIPAYLRDHPHDADILHNYVVLLGKTGRFKAAIDAAGELVASVPDDPRGYVDLGILLARSGERAEARAIFVEGLRRFPAYPDLIVNLELLDGASVGPERE